MCVLHGTWIDDAFGTGLYTPPDGREFITRGEISVDGLSRLSQLSVLMRSPGPITPFYLRGQTR